MRTTFCSLVFVAAACGGSVVVDASGLGEGGGGGGAVGTTTGTGTSTATATATGTGTSTGTSTGSTGTATTTTGTSTGTGTGTGVQCEDDWCEDCQSCAIDGPCAYALDACYAAQQCLDFADCYGKCFDQCGDDEGCLAECTGSDPGATKGCFPAYPAGAQIYFELVDCVVCDQCTSSCEAWDFCN